MKSLLASTLIAFAVLGGSAVSARGDSITITGTVTGDASLTPTGTPGIYVANVTGEGSDSVLGAFDFHGTTDINFSSPPAIAFSHGSFTFVFSEGDLFAAGSGVGVVSGLGTATDSSVLVITGGTGEFERDKGELDLDQTIDVTGPLSESLTGSYSGLLVTPEPCSLALIASGAVFLVRRRRRAAPTPSL